MDSRGEAHSTSSTCDSAAVNCLLWALLPCGMFCAKLGCNAHTSLARRCHMACGNHSTAIRVAFTLV
jgi:hypothetical protein